MLESKPRFVSTCQWLAESQTSIKRSKSYIQVEKTLSRVGKMTDVLHINPILPVCIRVGILPYIKQHA